MIDEPTQTAAPAEGTTTPAASEPTFSAADVEAILSADRNERGASSEPSDPVAKFRSTVNGSKLYAAKPKAAQPAPQPQGSRLEGLVESLVALQVASMKPPAPPAPPKPMTTAEKLTSADESIWLNRGNPNSFSKADRQALIEQHANELRKQGFKGHVEQEAESRARSQIVAAAQKALANIRVVPGGAGFDLSILAGRR